MEETAREQNREPAETVEEAVGRYLATRRLASFSERMERRAREKGIREGDVSRLMTRQPENEEPAAISCRQRAFCWAFRPA